MFFTVSASLFSVFAHAALVTGIAVWVLKRRSSLEYSGVLPFSSIPLIPLGLLELYAFGSEAFIAFYGGNKFEYEAHVLRMYVPDSLGYVLNLIAVLSSQIFWIRRLRRSAAACVAVGLLNLFLLP